MKHPFAALASALLSSAMVFACAPAPQLPEGEQVLSEHEITVLVAGNAFTTDGKPDPKKMVEPPQICEACSGCIA